MESEEKGRFFSLWRDLKKGNTFEKFNLDTVSYHMTILSNFIIYLHILNTNLNRIRV